MDKKWFESLHKSRWHITKCIDEAFKIKNLDLIYKNAQRLHELTAYYERYFKLHMTENQMLKDENMYLEQRNAQLYEENFMLLSKQLGPQAYKNAKKLMDEHHEHVEKEYGTERN